MALKTEARKPLYAVVGAGDLAVENIKDLPTQVLTQASTLLPKTTALVAEIPARVSILPTKALTTYGVLVKRGEKLVRSIRKSSATDTATTQVKASKAQAKAATTSASKAAEKIG